MKTNQNKGGDDPKLRWQFKPNKNSPMPSIIGVHSGGYRCYHPDGTPYTDEEMEQLDKEIEKELEEENAE